MSTTPARGGASIVYQTPEEAASDSDLPSLLNKINKEASHKRVVERQRGVATFQRNWRCARALSVGADGAAGRSGAAASSSGAANKKKKRRFKLTSPEGESTRSLPKCPKICVFRAKEGLKASALHLGGLPDDPISEFKVSYDSSSEHDSDETGERSRWTKCPDCGGPVEVFGAQCPCDGTYEDAPESSCEKDDEDDEDDNKEN